MTGPQFRVRLDKTPGAGAEGFGGYLPSGDFVVSYVNLDVEIGVERNGRFAP